MNAGLGAARCWPHNVAAVMLGGLRRARVEELFVIVSSFVLNRPGDGRYEYTLSDRQRVECASGVSH
jgi:hypothetical protein